MPTPDADAEVRAVLSAVANAGQDLEDARSLLIARAMVALAAGAHESDVAKAAGVRPRTLKLWLTRGWRFADEEQASAGLRR